MGGNISEKKCKDKDDKKSDCWLSGGWSADQW